MKKIEFLNDMIRLLQNTSTKEMPKRRIYINYLQRQVQYLLTHGDIPVKIKYNITLDIE
jgi:hypothetical protein